MDLVDERTRRQLVLTRRLYLLWAALALAVVLVLCVLLISMFRGSPLQPVSLGALANYAPNTVTLKFVNADFTDPETNKQLTTLSLNVAEDANGHFTVFYARSTDPIYGALPPRQCVVQWDAASERFVDSCGGSQWTRDGKYAEGPAPRDLDQFPVVIQGRNLMINLNLIEGAPHS